MRKDLKKLLFPFALVYGLFIALRNKFYDLNILKTFEIPIKSIVVGNLSVGGTGKTPYVLMIANQFSEKKIGVLSRGYGRKTKGFFIVNKDHTAQDVGDEPLLFRQKLASNCIVAVCENRKVGIQKLLEIFPEIELIILDDAFQHRRIKPGFSIVLSEYNKPFFNDYILPVGYLREWKSGIKRADLLIFTKCPKNLTLEDQCKYVNNTAVNLKGIYFSTIIHQQFKPLNHEIEHIENILLVSGIANPQPLIKHLENKFNLELMSFKDHHIFTESDITKIQQKFDNFATDNKIILTTEKDAVRLNNYLKTNPGKLYPWYSIPIAIGILEEEKFFNELNDYVGKI